ncbi:MAG: hypothetical protein ACOC8B_08080 [Gemmatimonadota bacterium]
MSGDSAYQFCAVTGAVRLADGRIAVANAGTSEFRYYDEAGACLGAAGRGGPGEFGFMNALTAISGDTLVAWDGRLRRVSRWTDDGAFVGSGNVVASFANAPQFLGVVGDTAFALGDRILSIPSTGFEATDVHFIRASFDGAVRDTIGTFTIGRMGRLGDTGLVGGPAFEPQTVTAAGPWGLAVGWAAEPEVRYHGGGSAEPSRITRWAEPPRSVTDEDIARYRERELGRADSPDGRRRIEAILEARPIPDVFPYFDELTTDRAGNLWVRIYAPPGDTLPRSWWVLDPEGRMIARAEIPRAVQRVLEIGEDHLLGIVRDELDVEHVHMYGLVREEAG